MHRVLVLRNCRHLRSWTSKTPRLFDSEGRNLAKPCELLERSCKLRRCVLSFAAHAWLCCSVSLVSSDVATSMRVLVFGPPGQKDEVFLMSKSANEDSYTKRAPPEHKHTDRLFSSVILFHLLVARVETCALEHIVFYKVFEEVGTFFFGTSPKACS